MDDNGCNISNFELLQFFHPENKLLKEIPEIVNFHKKLWLATLVLPASAMCHMSLCVFCAFRPAALFYYLQAADGGIEVGNFNLALLCEENKVQTHAH